MSRIVRTLGLGAGSLTLLLIAAFAAAGVRAETRDPIAHLAFDEGAGTSAADASGSGHNGTISGAAWTTGQSGGALSFDGVDDSVAVATPSTLEPPTVTVSAWVRGTPEAGQVVLAKGDYACAGPSFGFITTEMSVRFEFRWERYDGVQFSFYGEGYVDESIWDGEWHLITGTSTGLEGQVWIDSIPGSSIAFSNGFHAIYDGSTDALSIGASPATCAGRAPFDGDIDDVRVYDRILSRDEMAAFMPPVPTTIDPLELPAASVWGDFIRIRWSVPANPRFGMVEIWDQFNGQDLLVASQSTEFWQGGIGEYQTPQRSETFPPLDPGTHHFRARYVGSPPWQDSAWTPAVDHVVAKSPTEIDLQSGPNPTVPGTAVTFTASVGPYVTGGSVSFWKVVDGMPVRARTVQLGESTGGEHRTASWTTSNLPLGTTDVYAVYGGTAYEKKATSETIHYTVAKLVTKAVVSDDIGLVEEHHPVRLYGYISPATATGTVTYRDTFKGVTKTIATLQTNPGSGYSDSFVDIPSMKPGTHTVTMEYSGDGQHLPTTSTPWVKVVEADRVHASQVGVDLWIRTFYPVVDGYLDTVTARGNLEEPASVSIRIENEVTGALVRSFNLGSLGVGWYTKAWDGKNASGQLVPEGWYDIVQTIRDGGGIVLRDETAVYVSRKKLVSHVFAQTRAGNAYTTSGKTGSATISKAASAWTSGVRLGSGAVGNEAWVGYDITVPKSVTATKLGISTRGNAILSAPPGVFMGVFNYKTGEYDWEGITVPTTLQVTPADHVSARRVVHVVLFVQNTGAGASFDVRDVSLSYTYTTLE